MQNLMKASLLAAALALGTTAFAQNTEPTAPQQPMHHQPNPAHEAKHLSKQLGLTADQTAKLEPILAERQQKMSDLLATNPDPKTMHQQRKAIMQDSDAKLGAILTPDQQTQYAALKAEHKHKQGDAPMPPPSA